MIAAMDEPQAIVNQVTLGDVSKFVSYDIVVATMRYLILRGRSREKENFQRFEFEGETIHIPEWYLKRCHLLG